jgi:anti-anti-sigma factor
LSEIDFIGSRGMGILFHLHKVLTDVKRTLVLVEPSAVVAEALEIGGIGSLLQIYTSETEAVKEAV